MVVSQYSQNLRAIHQASIDEVLKELPEAQQAVDSARLAFGSTISAIGEVYGTRHRKTIIRRFGRPFVNDEVIYDAEQAEDGRTQVSCIIGIVAARSFQMGFNAARAKGEA